MSAKTEEVKLPMFFYIIIVMNILFVDNDIDSTNKSIKLNLQTQLANEKKVNLMPIYISAAIILPLRLPTTLSQTTIVMLRGIM